MTVGLASSRSRRTRKAVVVLAGSSPTGDGPARALAGALGDIGVEAVYLGRQSSARRIAAMALDCDAQAIEVCLSGGGGVLLLRQLLRELAEVGRRNVGIVVHRVG
jgi:methylmalonyl-CoA mutase cobalamin-binding domain/chain